MITKSTQLEFLYTLASSLTLGHPPHVTFKMLAESSSGELKKLFQKAYILSTKKKLHIDEVLFKIEIITPLEKAMIASSKERLKNVIENIIKLRKVSGQFSGIFVSNLLKLYLANLIGMLGVYFAYPTMADIVNTLIQTAKYRGIIVDGNIAPVFWFINHREIVPVVATIISIIFFSILIVYFILKKTKPDIIYKVSKTAAYDDMPIIFYYLENLKSGGMTLLQVVQTLEKNLPIGYKRLFRGMVKAIKNHEKIWKKFQMYNLPAELVIFIKYSEESQNFWEQLSNVIAFIEDRNKKLINKIQTTVSPLITYLSFGMLIYYAMGLMVYMFKLQTIASAMM